MACREGLIGIPRGAMKRNACNPRGFIVPLKSTSKRARSMQFSYYFQPDDGEFQGYDVTCIMSKEGLTKHLEDEAMESHNSNSIGNSSPNATG